MRSGTETSRLSFFEAAWVVARRDFKAVLFSRAFFFFLLGPLFPIVVGAMAGGIGGQVQREAIVNIVALAMTDADNTAIFEASELARGKVDNLPQLTVVDTAVREAGDFAPKDLLRNSDYAVVVTGTLDRPVLTGTHLQIHRWDGQVSMLAAMARGTAPTPRV